MIIRSRFASRPALHGGSFDKDKFGRPSSKEVRVIPSHSIWSGVDSVRDECK